MKELIEPITINNLKKIVDDMYALGPNVVLRFNVECSRNVGNKTYPFYSEYEYPCDTGSVDSLVSIKRVYDYYLSIENVKKDDNGNKVFIRISVNDFLMFRNAIDVITSWFTEKKYKNLFAINSTGALIIAPPIPSHAITGLPMGRYLEFVPTIIDKGMANADKERGVRMFLSEDSSFVDLNLNKIAGLKYLLEKCDMFGYAQNLANAVNPILGTNRVNLADSIGSKKPRELKMVDSHTPLSGTTGISSGRKVGKGGNDISSLEE